MTTIIDNNADIIDSRDVIARIAELESDRDAYEGVRSWASENEDEAAELKALIALQDDAEGYAPDWRDGATLIRDSYFQTYAEELVSDIGDLPRDMPSYLVFVIDWEATALNIQQDYTSVEFDGVEYWIR